MGVQAGGGMGRGQLAEISGRAQAAQWEGAEGEGLVGGRCGVPCRQGAGRARAVGARRG